MNHLGPKNIETERLILRKYVLEDAKDIFKNIMSTGVHLDNPHKTLDETKNALVNWIKDYEKTSKFIDSKIYSIIKDEE